MTRYEVHFDPRAFRDGWDLPLFLRRRIRGQLDFVSAAPYRSHPGVRVKEGAGLRGVWRFHAAHDVRVYYTVVGDVVWVVRIERGARITATTVEELGRRLRGNR